MKLFCTCMCHNCVMYLHQMQSSINKYHNVHKPEIVLNPFDSTSDQLHVEYSSLDVESDYCPCWSNPCKVLTFAVRETIPNLYSLNLNIWQNPPTNWSEWISLMFYLQLNARQLDELLKTKLIDIFSDW